MTPHNVALGASMRADIERWRSGRPMMETAPTPPRDFEDIKDWRERNHPNSELKASIDRLNGFLDGKQHNALQGRSPW
jgi:hypothetical protein